MKKVIATLIFIACAVSCNKDRLDHDVAPTIPLTKSEGQFAVKSNDFSSELLQMYYDKKGEAYDFVLSPISLQMYLGMLNAGADEERSAQINRMLGYEGASVEEINSFCKKVLETSPKLDPKVKVDVANQMWLDSAAGFNLFPTYAQMLKDNYQVVPETRDFTADPMYDITRSWITEKTRGMLNFGVLPPYFRSILVNVTYFKAEWNNPFDKARSEAGKFYREDGSVIEVKYMNRIFREVELYENDTFQALYLPFGDGAFRMEFYLPRIGKNIKDAISELRTGSYPKKGETGQSPVKLPSFDLEFSNYGLVSDLYKHFQVSLSGEYPLCGEDNDGDGLKIDRIAHAARIKVYEEGAEAAAVTANYFMAATLSDPRGFYATRPFVFVIREVGSGIAFFSGVYAGKSSKE